MGKEYFSGLLLFSIVFLSCTENKEPAIERKAVKNAIGKQVTDHVAPPVVTPIGPGKPLRVTITSKAYSLDPGMGKEAITTLTPANGLPAGWYNKVVQDRAGNFWFNASTRIVKYDGHQFTSFSTIPGGNDRISDIALDSDNKLWEVVYKMSSSGTKYLYSLYIFNGVSFDPVPYMQNVSNQAGGISIYPQPDETIWVTDGVKILKFIGRQLVQTITQSDFSFKWIYDIKTDRQGDTWFLDRIDSTLTRYDGRAFEKLTHRDGLPKTALRAVIPFAADSMYLSTLNGIWFFDGRQSTKLNDNTSSALLLDKSGSVWFNASFLGGESLSKISASGITTIGKEDGLDVATTGWNFGLDNDDNVWVLTRNTVKRLYKPVTSYGELFPTTSFTQVRPGYIDKRRNYWIGSFQHGLSCFNGKTVTNYSFPGSNASNFVQADNNILAVTEDKVGNIWFTTAAPSLIKFDGQSFFQYNKSNGWSFHGLGLLLEVDKLGNIWTNSFNEGIAYLNGKEKVTFTTKQGLCSNSVNCLFEDRTGAMWFGTPNGLSRLHDGRFTTFNTLDGLANKSINAITDDKYGNLWIGTNGGVSRFDGEQFINYTTEDGSVEGAVRVIQKDSVNNFLWLTSESGFTAITIKANHPDSVVFESFSEADGYPLIGFKVLIDHNGALWTSESNNSLTRFDYRKVKKNSKPFILHINQIRLNNEILCWSNLKDNDKDSMALQMEMQLSFGRLLSRDKLEQMASQFNGVRYDSIIPFDFIPYNLSLPYKANSISFDFAAIDPHFSKSTRYQYQLEGLDKTWSPLSKNTNVNFSNLFEGSYVFKLKALNPYGKWSELSYAFHVRPPLYRSWWAYLGYFIIFLFIVRRVHLYQKNKAIQKERARAQQKELAQAREIEKAYTDLKATQAQLIQSEKMASLGELTAGIAHEIQNPLNFVNNFSEVNAELIEEQKEELDKGNINEAKTLANEIAENEKKIIHHGKRADAIVKGMLQHSRSSNGVKEPTDINALCDEYLRLAYHARLNASAGEGLQAKDEHVMATMRTDFDETIGNVNIIPQDIGRVLLNLINNAFYAVHEKRKAGMKGYEPTVSVITRKEKDKVEIRVEDNGNGIPPKVLEKIFQPFFTTKPTGQGTGLGLSLSYDIVKAHGGELRVGTREGEGSVFTIQLPV